MASSVQPTDIYAPSADKLRRRSQDDWLRQLHTLAQGCIIRLWNRRGAFLVKHRVTRLTGQALLLTRGFAPRLQNAWEKTSPIFHSQIHKLPSSLPLLSPPDANEVEEVDDVKLVLSEFENLTRDQQDKVAKSLALLWDAFIDLFGGVSAFQATSLVEQQAFTKKLDTAARRMEVARGSDAAFHYVTVELMRQYVSFLQIGSKDPRAIILAGMVAPLIDQGRRINAESV
jgi:hypothetical protein